MRKPRNNSICSGESVCFSFNGDKPIVRCSGHSGALMCKKIKRKGKIPIKSIIPLEVGGASKMFSFSG